MTFFVSKYNTQVFEVDGPVILPVGTIFTIEFIDGNFFYLKPASSKLDLTTPIMISTEMLKLGFTEQDQIDIGN